MTRKQRLARLLAALARPGIHTLDDLAQRSGVGVRLLRQDLDNLALAGYPIEGDPDLGYKVARLSRLPPLILTDEELDTLRLALARLPGPEGASLSRLVDLAMPEYFPGIDLDNLTADVPGMALKASARHLPRLRRAIRLRHWIDIDYLDASGEATRRRLDPLGLEQWSDTWALIAWCTLRQDFRTFRLDRVQALTVSDDVAPHRLGRDLATFDALYRNRDD